MNTEKINNLLNKSFKFFDSCVADAFTEQCIKHIYTQYAIQLDKQPERRRVRSIANQEGTKARQHFDSCLSLLTQAKLLRNIKQYKKGAKDYQRTLYWLIKVADRNGLETVWSILDQLNSKGLLTQVYLHALQNRANERGFLTYLHDTFLLVDQKDLSSIHPADVQSIFKDLLLLPPKSLGPDANLSRSLYRCLVVRKEWLKNSVRSIDSAVCNQDIQQEHHEISRDFNKIEAKIDQFASKDISLRRYICYMHRLDSLGKNVTDVKRAIQEDQISEEVNIVRPSLA